MDDSLFPFEEFREDVIKFVTEECSWSFDEAQNYADSLHDYWRNGFSAKEAVLHDFSNTTIEEDAEINETSERNYIE